MCGLAIFFGLPASFVSTTPIKVDTVELVYFLLFFSCGGFLSMSNLIEFASFILDPLSKIRVRLWYFGVVVFKFVRSQKFLVHEIEGQR